MIAAWRPIGAPPLRFLLVLLGGWVAFRVGAFMLWPGVPVAELPAAIFADAVGVAPAPAMDRGEVADPPIRPQLFRVDTYRRPVPDPKEEPAVALALASGPRAPAETSRPAPPARAIDLPPDVGPPALTPPAASRWSASAWLLLRDDGGATVLAPGGTLGGSQAGARLLYRVGAGFSLSGRAYAPLRRTAGSEAALGLDWQPMARLPIHLLAERRFGLGREGRDAFSLTLYGGDSVALPYGARLDAYAQAGIVGLKARDLFVDGAVRVSAPLGPVEVGGGIWGAAQPGVSRLDAGPHISWRLPVRRANLRLTADWRFRIAGEAAPGSGPALTLAADF